MRRPLLLVCLCYAAFAALWLQVGSPPAAGYMVRDDSGRILRDSEQMTVTGKVYRTQTRESYGREFLKIYLHSVTIQQSDASGSEANISFSMDMICEVLQAERPKLGSWVQVRGQFMNFTQATNQGEFDNAQYYSIRGIGGSLQKAKLLDYDTRYSLLLEGLYQLKGIWKERICRCFPEKEASILSAMLLGEKDTLDKDIKKLYKRNGIVHILSISGLHITLIGMGLYRLLRRIGCPVAVAAGAGVIILVLYGIMTGMELSACRAIGMYLIRMLGECLGRTYDMLTALAIMGLLMLIKQPEYLRHSGFLLSFGSICAIGILLPGFTFCRNPDQKNKDTHKQPGWSPRFLRYFIDSGLKPVQKSMQIVVSFCKNLKQSFIAGLSITLFTLPVHLYYYYEIPVWSVLLNLLILPFMSIVMTLGLAVMLIPGAGFLSIVVQTILTGYEAACLFCDKLPFHTWTPGRPDIWQLALYYLLLFLAVWRGHYSIANILKVRFRGKPRQLPAYKSICARIFLLLASVFVLGVRLRSGFMVTFLDVGQGDCILVRTDAGEVYLFDGGSSDKSQVGNYILLPFLKYQGIRHLDAVFVSHPDKDHCSGILELLEAGISQEITIGKLVLPSIAKDLREQELGKLITSAQNAGSSPPAIAFIAKGDSFQSGNTLFTCLHPPVDMSTQDANAYSECFLVQYKDFSLLLTGDVEGEGETALLQELEERQTENLTILKIAHHGSRNSTSSDFLAQLTPRLAVISCGTENSYGHPHKELLMRLQQEQCEVIQTSRQGAITVSVRGSKVALRFVLNNETP